jgi:predicted nucleic acid-binding protein
VRYLLDTNVVSELRKPARSADPHVRSWAAAQQPPDTAISVITVMEIEIGIRRLARRDRVQAQRLRAWLEDVILGGFAGRILPVDLGVAHRAAPMHVPDPGPERDVLIAATAADRGLIVVTRNVADFESLGVPVLDPWLPS